MIKLSSILNEIEIDPLGPKYKLFKLYLETDVEGYTIGEFLDLLQEGKELNREDFENIASDSNDKLVDMMEQLYKIIKTGDIYVTLYQDVDDLEDMDISKFKHVFHHGTGYSSSRVIFTKF